MRAARRVLAALLSAVTAGGVVVVVGLTTAPAATALTGSQWNAGSIISDSVFYDFGTMNADQVQGFLNDKGSGCRAANGLACLKDYVQVPPSRTAENGLCAGYTASAAESAASMVVNVARSCRINPRSLLVLLEKESSLVTRTTPSTTAYRSATGYGCPDTAACDATYYGFFNQVYMAARQFKVYATNPTRYGYQAGRVNSILYNPNTGCGSGSVYIANQATAGLYTYTPYQPNGAALADLYGPGDSCSAYGNRNFWRIFSDWFGDTQTGSYLLRTAEDATVYLVSGQKRYSVPDLATLSTLAPLGSVGVVSVDYLAGFEQGRTLGRFVRGPDGTVFFLDGSVLHPVQTCGLVADFGDDCAASVPLTSTQVALFSQTSVLTGLVSTTSGKTFVVGSGRKRESLDDAALTAAGMGGPRVVLSEASIATLPYGPPVVRDDVLVVSRSTAAVWLTHAGRLTPVPASINVQNVWSRSLAAELLDAQSVAALPQDLPYTGFVRGSDPFTSYLLTPTGRRQVADPAAWSATFTAVSDTLLARLGDEGALTSPGYLRGASDPTIVRIAGAVARPVISWVALVALNGGTLPTVVVVADAVADSLPKGTPLLQPGGLVLDGTDGTVSLVDGTSQLVPLSSFRAAARLGIATTFTEPPRSTVSGYPRAGGLSSLVRCGTQTFLGRTGPLDLVTSLGSSALPVTPLSPVSCTLLALPRASAAAITSEVFAVSDGDATVYRVTATDKRPVTSWARLIELNNGSPSPVIAALGPALLATVPTGPPA
ncbi:hypothetical protein RHODO2019_15695 [Rhodococcus antarcticus]|uniref:Uncharacterized protein n=1 Tax=Rhodococcus antarcticus TaxID=2987751 RepID=A0ABY6P068_9NOCA|nr:hypothetical protein [Rhodococcus antarcticus]UZJ24548.1 hypothetical protein RHODO2019_15695 [Rhodococcus antarcticus]